MERNILINGHAHIVSSDDNYLDAIGDDFEPHMVQLFKTLIDSTDTAIDVGANIGLTSILFSSLASKVFSFEPSPSTYKILNENLSRSNITNVKAVNIGLGQNKEAMTISFAPNNRSGGFINESEIEFGGHTSENIYIDTLDNYFSDAEPSRYFMKIDVEGFEQNVIKGGMGGFLSKHKPVVVMEMNHFCLNVLHRITIPEFMDFMRSVFPYLYAVDSDNSVIADLHDPDSAYMVMYTHVIHQRFPNLVGGFDESLKQKLDLISVETPTVNTPEGTIQVGSAVETAASNERFRVSVTILNTGTEEWSGTGSRPVRLSYHWKNIDGSVLVFDGIRTELSEKTVPAGGSVRQHVNVIAPSEKGVYTLVLTVVQEGVCWFEDLGFQPLTWDVNVS